MAIVIPYVKQTWVDGPGGGTPTSAARLGVIEEGILDVSQAPAVRVYHSANQSCTNATDTTLSFDSERFDQAGGAASNMHDTVTNNSRLTCRYPGVYLIVAHVNFQDNATGSRLTRIRLNATSIIGANATGPDPTTGIGTAHTVVTTYVLAVNDYVEVWVRQDSGGALNVLANAAFSPEFSMVRIA